MTVLRNLFLVSVFLALMATAGIGIGLVLWALNASQYTGTIALILGFPVFYFAAKITYNLAEHYWP